MDFSGRGSVSHVFLVGSSGLKLGCRSRRDMLHSLRPSRELGAELSLRCAGLGGA